MRALGKRRLPLTGLVGVAAVAAGLAAQERPDRSRPPTPGPIPALHLPTIQERSLGNGLAILIVEQHKVPVVEVQLILRAGGSTDPPGRFGLASLTATMLDEGAGDRDALAIADAIDYLGAELETNTSFDASTLRLYAPVARLAEALPIAADVVRRPTFPASELERIRKLRLTALLQARDRPGQIAGFALSRTLYGEIHRYGTPDEGTPETVRAFTVEDLHGFHQAYYRPDLARCSLSVT